MNKEFKDNIIRTTEEARAKGRKGGAAGKGKKRPSVRFKFTKCKNCKLPCPFKQEGIEKDAKCKVADVKRMILEAVDDPKKLVESMFFDAFKLQTMGKSSRDIKLSFDAKLALKKEIDPAVQRLQIEGEVPLIMQVVERVKERKQLEEQQDGQQGKEGQEAEETKDGKK